MRTVWGQYGVNLSILSFASVIEVRMVHRSRCCVELKRNLIYPFAVTYSDDCECAHVTTLDDQAEARQRTRYRFLVLKSLLSIPNMSPRSRYPNLNHTPESTPNHKWPKHLCKAMSITCFILDLKSFASKPCVSSFSMPLSSCNLETLVKRIFYGRISEIYSGQITGRDRGRITNRYKSGEREVGAVDESILLDNNTLKPLKSRNLSKIHMHKFDDSDCHWRCSYF